MDFIEISANEMNIKCYEVHSCVITINPLNDELNPIRHLLALIGDRHIVHVSRIRVKETENLYLKACVSQRI